MSEGAVQIVLAIIGGIVTIILALLPKMFSKLKDIHIMVNSQSEAKTKVIEKQEVSIAKQEAANKVLHDTIAALKQTNADLQFILAHTQPAARTEPPPTQNPT